MAKQFSTGFKAATRSRKRKRIHRANGSVVGRAAVDSTVARRQRRQPPRVSRVRRMARSRWRLVAPWKSAGDAGFRKDFRAAFDGAALPIAPRSSITPGLAKRTVHSACGSNKTFSIPTTARAARFLHRRHSPAGVHKPQQRTSGAMVMSNAPSVSAVRRVACWSRARLQARRGRVRGRRGRSVRRSRCRGDRG